MLNIEKYKDELLQFGLNFTVDKYGNPHKCGLCRNCLFKNTLKDPCCKSRMKWLLSEYKETPKLTKEERGFCEFTQTGWIVREPCNDVYILSFFEYKPIKRQLDCSWHCAEGISFYLKDVVKDGNSLFNFITWEDKEPWSIEELLKLGVE